MKISQLNKINKYLFGGVFLLLLFHFESISIGLVKISHLWKGVLLVFLLIKIINRKKNQFSIYPPLIWLAILQLINVELVNNSFNAILLFGTTLILPLLGIYVLRFTPKQLENGLLFFASFFILSFVPYELGILNSLGKHYTLTSYGVDQSGIVGPFQGVHSASVALAGSFLVILFFWFEKKINRYYLSILLILGFYFLINTYVRTGMLMVIVGSIPMLIYFAKKSATMRVRLILIGGLFSVLISGWVLSNETLMDRITGKRINSIETDSFENLGSGRGLIYIYSIEIFIEANPFEKIIGIGQTEEKKRMEQKLGSAIIPHNGFLLILLNNGLIGLILFLYFVRELLKKTRQFHPNERSLVKGLIYAYLIMTFFQNYDILYMYLVLILGFTYARSLTSKKSILT